MFVVPFEKRDYTRARLVLAFREHSVVFLFHALQHMFNVDFAVVPGKTPQPFDSHGSLAAAWSPPAGAGGRTRGITGCLHQSR